MTRQAPQRTPLDRARVLDAAIRFADLHGLDAMTMRALAAELGVVPMALYKHVAAREELTDAMVDTVIAGYRAPAPGLVGAEAVRARILDAREKLLQHPWLRGAIEAARHRTPAVLDHMNELAGEFIEDGYSTDLTHHAMHALGHRIWGFSPEAFDETPAAPPPPAEQEATVRMMTERYPHIVAIARESAVGPGGRCDEQYEFEFTLDLLLESFARLRDAGWSSRGR